MISIYRNQPTVKGTEEEKLNLIFSMYEELKQKKIAPTENLINTLVGSCCTLGSPRRAVALAEDIVKYNVPLSEVHLSCHTNCN